MSETKIRPFLDFEDTPAPRLEALPAPLPAQPDPAPRLSTPALTLGGALVLGTGFAALSAGNFVAAEFDRSPALGWATLAVAVGGFGLFGAGLWRELRSLLALRTVDRLRADLNGNDIGRARAAARRWLAGTGAGTEETAALDAAAEPETLRAMLRAGPATALRGRVDALARTASFQVVAGMAATPAPALTVLLVGWRGLRLVRQVAALHGMRPGLLGTLALLRRTMLAATAAAATEAAVNAVAHAVLSNPLLQHALGEMAGAGIAARRMLVLARAADAACNPLD